MKRIYPLFKHAPLLALTGCLVAATPQVMAWGSPHESITRAALAVQPEALQALWSQPYRHPLDNVERPISEYLCSYWWWCGNPDHVEGPTASAAQKNHVKQFMYGEQDSRFAVPTPYGLPMPETGSVWGYHYFHFPPADSRGRYIRGAQWYFEHMIEAFRDNRPADAAQYAGTFAHAVEDRSSTVHAWDGYGDERHAIEKKYGLTTAMKHGMSVFWFIDDNAVEAAIPDYTPQLLGPSVEAAAAAVGQRMEAISDESRALLADPENGYLAAHREDDWQNAGTSDATNAAMDAIARTSSRLTADIFYTAWHLAYLPPPLATNAAHATVDAPLAADTWVRSSEPDTVQDHTMNLSCGYQDYTFLKFDLSGIDAGAYIRRATLTIRIRNDFKSDNVVNLHAVPDSGWDEETMTPSSAPEAGELLAKFTAEASEPGISQLDEIDVTAYIKKAQAADQELTAMRMTMADKGPGVFIRAREHRDQSEQPWARLSLQLKQPGESVLELADDGKTEYRIIVDDEADVSTHAVANDLAALLTEITGATFPVATDKTAPSSHEIVLGNSNRRLESLQLTGLTENFVEDEYEIRTVGTTLVIAGAPPRGTINGIYGFLQDHLGCRWFTAGVSHIPKIAALSVKIADRQRPAFEQRSVLAPSHWDAAWTARNRLNVCKTYGGAQSRAHLMNDKRVQTIWDYYESHGLANIPESLFREHPEFYAKIGGERSMHEEGNRRAYCITNPEFVTYVAEWLGRQVRNVKGPIVVGLGHTDSDNRCLCDVCKASYDHIGLAGTYMAFDNAVAKQLDAVNPDAIVDTLSYGMTFAPTPVKMAPNVRVTWCPISGCYAHAFGQCAVNRDRGHLEKLTRWQANTDQLQIWYYHYQADNLMPHLRLNATRENFQEFHRRGIQAIFVESYGGTACLRTHPVPDGDKLIPAFGAADRGEYFTVPMELDHLRSYILCRLLWNPDYEIETGIREFCHGYYGAAGPDMVEYVLAVESLDSYARTTGSYEQYDGVHQSCGAAPELKWDVTGRLSALFDRAEARVATDSVLLRRIQMARLPLQLSILCYAAADDPLRQPAFNGFFQLTEELGLKVINRSGISYKRMALAEFKKLVSDPTKIIRRGEEPLGANLLRNSNFELDQDADGIPDGWTATGKYNPEGYDLDPAGVSLDAERAYSGKHSVKLIKQPAARQTVALRQRFQTTPGTSYRMSIRYQADVGNGSVVIIFTQFDADGTELGHNGSAGGIKSTGEQWAEMHADTTADENTAELMVEFLLYDDQAEGVAWIDDFFCAPIK